MISYYIKVAIWWFNLKNADEKMAWKSDLRIYLTYHGLRHFKDFDDLWEMRDWVCEQANVPYGQLPCGATGWNFSDIEPQYEQAVES